MFSKEIWLTDTIMYHQCVAFPRHPKVWFAVEENENYEIMKYFCPEEFWEVME